MNFNDIIAAALYIRQAVNTTIDLVDDAPLQVDETEVAKELIRRLAGDHGLGVKVPGDTLCGRCGKRSCTSPASIEIDPLCWPCIIEMNNLDDLDD